jgi:hypothetical protein
MEDRARILEDRIEDLAREIAETINQATDVPGRPDIRGELKDFAIHLLQDSVVTAEPAAEVVTSSDATFNPLGMGIPLFFAGCVLVFLFPPVGMMMFAGSIVMIVWGLLASMRRRVRR